MKNSLSVFVRWTSVSGRSKKKNIVVKESTFRCVQLETKPHIAQEIVETCSTRNINKCERLSLSTNDLERFRLQLEHIRFSPYGSCLCVCIAWCNDWMEFSRFQKQIWQHYLTIFQHKITHCFLSSSMRNFYCVEENFAAFFFTVANDFLAVFFSREFFFFVFFAPVAEFSIRRKTVENHIKRVQLCD